MRIFAVDRSRLTGHSLQRRVKICYVRSELSRLLNLELFLRGRELIALDSSDPCLPWTSLGSIPVAWQVHYDWSQRSTVIHPLVRSGDVSLNRRRLFRKRKDHGPVTDRLVTRKTSTLCRWLLQMYYRVSTFRTQYLADRLQGQRAHSPLNYSQSQFSNQLRLIIIIIINMLYHKLINATKTPWTLKNNKWSAN